MVSINGTVIAMPADPEKLFEILGQPTRRAKLANMLHTWDELGLIAYERPGTGKVQTISVALDKQPYKFWPKSLFGGTLIIDGAKVTAQSTIQQINADKSGVKFGRDDAIGDTWAIEHKTCLITLRDADSKIKSEGARLSNLQIGVRR